MPRCISICKLHHVSIPNRQTSWDMCSIYYFARTILFNHWHHAQTKQLEIDILNLQHTFIHVRIIFPCNLRWTRTYVTNNIIFNSILCGFQRALIKTDDILDRVTFCKQWNSKRKRLKESPHSNRKTIRAWVMSSTLSSWNHPSADTFRSNARTKTSPSLPATQRAQILNVWFYTTEITCRKKITEIKCLVDSLCPHSEKAKILRLVASHL